MEKEGNGGKSLVEKEIKGIMVHNLNEVMGIDKENWPKEHKAPVGLAGSKYATLVPGFEDHPRHQPHYYTSRSFRSSSLRGEVFRNAKSGVEEKGKGLPDSFESSSSEQESQPENPKSNIPLLGESINQPISQPIAGTPPRVNLYTLLTSPEIESAAEGSSEVSPISSANGKKIEMHHIPGVSPPPTIVLNEEKEKVNPDEIVLGDSEDEN